MSGESLSSVKNQRTVRRGRLTTLKQKLDEIVQQDLPYIDPSVLVGLRKSLQKEADLHRDLQARYEQILGEQKKESEDQTAHADEIETGADYQDTYDDYVSTATQHIEDFDTYKDAERLKGSYTEWVNVADPDARTFIEDSKNFISRIEAFLERSERRAVSDLINQERLQLKSLLGEIHKQVNGIKGDTATSKAASRSEHAYHHKSFDIDLPTFHGSPTTWMQFHKLFTTTIEKRGKHLASEEKCCLLLKSLKDPQARDLAQLNTDGDDGYDRAMTALVQRYGQAHVVMPHHVANYKTSPCYTFSRDSLLQLGKGHISTFKALTAMEIDFSTFTAAYVATLFDAKLAEEWSKYTMSLSTLPTMSDLEAYAQSLICRLPTTTSSSPTFSHNHKNKPSPAVKTESNKPKFAVCVACNDGQHPLSRCQAFKDLNPERRGKLVRDKRWCVNCLHHSHSAQHCTSSFTCRHCNGRHHSLLHRGDATNSSSQATTNPSTTSTSMVSTLIGRQFSDQKNSQPLPPTHSFLNTAMVKASYGGRHRISRVALDSGSSTSLITECLASQLKLKRYPQQISLEGAYAAGSSKHYVQVILSSLHSSESITLRLSVVSKLPYATPPARIAAISSDVSIRDRQLADPQFGGRLDILLGSLDVCRCLKGNLIYFSGPNIAVSPTIFGWTVTGPLDIGQSSKFLSIQSSADDLNESLQRLWELEQVPETVNNSPAEVSALQQFETSHQTDESGRYSVSLPRIASLPQLGLSKPTALSRFYQNEKSLAKKDKLNDFNNSLAEYRSLDHAEQVPLSQLKNDSYYLPVHGVFKSSSSTTKVRPVFDASAKSSNGVSLNDLLLAGPNLYPLLTDILIQFRTHVIGFSADISKMFREILLNTEERDLHRFLMRDENGQLSDYRMKRLTFGVKSSPFLATKVLHDLAEKNSSTYPLASSAILNHFYVDDFLSGASSVSEAVHIRKQICELLSKAGMTLRKWRSSCPEFAATIPEQLRETDSLTVSETPKALGIHWDVRSDNFNIATPDIIACKKVTKRLIASLSGKVYDILGLFAPFVIRSKLILQQLWKEGCGWDDEVPEYISQLWKEWTEELPSIHTHPIPRRYYTGSSTVVHSSLHGFSDASTLAYGAVVYLRLQLADGTVSTALVISKARVAPLKPTTIPRAELVAAHLLTKLLVYAAKFLNVPLNQVYPWTDSTIILCWLRKLPSTLQLFVANRISYIQNSLPDVSWKHVPTKQNPADLLSRGVSSSTLSQESLWWQGPPWLARPPDEWAPQDHLVKVLPKSLPEQKAITLTVLVANYPPFDLWTKYSSYYKLNRIIAWLKRFIANSRLKREDRTLSHQLLSSELRSAKVLLLKTSQQDSFPDVSSTIKRKTALSLAHPLARLNVHISDDGLIIVSGRLRQDSSRQPKTVVALSLKSTITQLLVQSAHHIYNHPGVSALLAILTENFFIPGLKNFLKKLSRNCATCQKAYAKTLQPQMGLLPPERTTPAPPFQTTGLDFAGPFTIKKGHTRRPTLIKTYVCVFVCFTTKAIHLELCSDLTTEAFLAAFKRFCARRGTPSDVHSDNGTNFVGAAAELQQCQHLLQYSRNELSHLCTSAQITWHFIPPRAPNFGGLWEAGVRQMKLLLRKQIAPHPLTFEELTTVIADVESILNSRPIVPMDATELQQDLVLTPGHFLIGRPLKAPANPNKSDAKISSLRRWNLVQRLQQELWLSWQGWYRQTLMQRKKWHKHSRDIKEGDIVLLKDEALTSQTNSWPMAKITHLHYGDDGVARTADVLCRGKTYKRSVGRFVPLFSSDSLNT